MKGITSSIWNENLAKPMGKQINKRLDVCGQDWKFHLKWVVCLIVIIWVEMSCSTFTSVGITCQTKGNRNLSLYTTTYIVILIGMDEDSRLVFFLSPSLHIHVFFPVLCFQATFLVLGYYFHMLVPAANGKTEPFAHNWE
jgi:hypothetical protein